MFSSLALKTKVNYVFEVEIITGKFLRILGDENTLLQTVIKQQESTHQYQLDSKGRSNLLKTIE